MTGLAALSTLASAEVMRVPKPPSSQKNRYCMWKYVDIWWYWHTLYTATLAAFWPLRLGSLPLMTCSIHSWQDDFFSANTMNIPLLNCQTVTTLVALTTPLQDAKGICNPSHALCMSLSFQTTKAIKNFHIWMFLMVPSTWHCHHPNGPPAKPSKDRARNVPATGCRQSWQQLRLFLSLLVRSNYV